MCPKCQSLSIVETTDNDDPHRVFFCGNCSYQARQLEFEQFPEPEAEETPGEKPCLLKRLVNAIRG